MSSNYLQQVTAVIDTTSTFGTTLKQLKDNVTALQTQMSTLLADAPGTLDTLNEIAGAINDDPAFFSSMATANTTLQTNIDNLTAAAATARTARHRGGPDRQRLSPLPAASADSSRGPIPFPTPLG